MGDALTQIEMVVLDVDGVLTDGAIVVDSNGVETKTFHVHDGSAIKWAMRDGLTLAIMSGRRSAVVDHRCDELGITHLYQNILNKGEMIDQVVQDTGIPLEKIAFVGDDFLDVPVMRKVGYAVAVANARDEVKAIADYVTVTPGGRGAVREFLEKLLRARGAWDGIQEKYRL